MSNDGQHAGAGPTLLGGEMTGWRDGIDPPTALSEWVAAVLDDAEGSVLLIGPRAATLARRLGERATVLVRGTIDAVRLHAEGVDVHCGGLDRLPLRSAYDTVVILDPPERVLTPDSPGLGHFDLLDLAVSHADGRFIAYVPNALAVEPVSQGRASGDTSWWVGTPGYDDRPPVRADLPESASHLVLGDAVVLDGARVTDPLAGTTVRAALPAHPDWLDALRAGAVRQLASGWVLVRGRDLPELPAVFAPTLPDNSHTDGEPLEVLLVAALRTGDLDHVRALVVRYGDHVNALPADQRGHAVPRNTVVGEDGVLARRVLVQGADVAAPVAVAHGLWDAAALVAGTSQHPYAPELDAAGIAHELGALAGRADLDQDAWRHAEKLRYEVALPARHPRAEPAGDAPRVAQLESALREREGKITYLEGLATRQERRIRALEHAIETEHGPRARQALFLMTAPTSRLVEAARNRINKPG
ncbi:hypothetical protein [Allobranchiibius sp. GilTou38]|uniref:hypothetical protein n=1 Tax=Allobranchiibius sp. GilTou38 TaxID=2815210 RepID=UPI001AA1CB58|nr:hypothetical protein [Allobranchiibius sp. GilTou38]MBO1765696.1 hypothetical protein [Allobranchiibius sp. GilTou38]